jgi:hypothetical protein
MGRVTERLGRSGEYFTASVLALVSDTVIIVPHGAEADIIFDFEDKLYKCQVKSKTKKEKNHNKWRFDLRRGSHTKNRHFEEGAIDIYALYSKQYNNVIFMPFDVSKREVRIAEDIMKNADSLATFHQTIKELNY